MLKTNKYNDIMLENIEFTMTDGEYAFLQEHFEAERNGCHIDYVGGPFNDVLDRAIGLVEKDEKARADFLSHECMDLVHGMVSAIYQYRSELLTWYPGGRSFTRLCSMGGDEILGILLSSDLKHSSRKTYV